MESIKSKILRNFKKIWIIYDGLFFTIKETKNYFFIKNFFNVSDITNSESNLKFTDEELIKLIDLTKNNFSKKKFLGGIWTRIIDNNFKELINDLNNSNIKGLREKFKNLGQREFTKGICLVGDRAGSKLQKYHLTNRINRNYKKFVSIYDDKFSFVKDFGNIQIFQKKEKCYQVSMFRHIDYAYNINNFTPKKVLEIGGGYGPVPYYLYKFFSFKGNYIICDLPEMLLISYIFLKQSLPDVNIVFGLPNQKSENTINLIVPQECENIENDSIDLTLNAHSLTEMDQEVFDYYLSIINKVTNKVFLSYNHDSEYEYWDNKNKIKKKHNSFSSLSTQNQLIQKFKLNSKKKEKFMEGMNLKMDYYEYVYTK